MQRHRPHRRRTVPTGFTLMEVIIVLAILGVIIGLVLPNLLGRQREALKGSTKLAIESVEQALKIYATDHDGEFPSTAMGLEALVAHSGNDPKWKGPYIEKGKLPADAWGNPLQYAYPSQHQTGDQPDVWSVGPDKQPNTADDVTNWSLTP